MPFSQPGSPLPIRVTCTQVQAAMEAPSPSLPCWSQQAHLGDLLYGSTCSYRLWLRNVTSQEDVDRGNLLSIYRCMWYV